jgi:hypothetical protein
VSFAPFDPLGYAHFQQLLFAFAELKSEDSKDLVRFKVLNIFEILRWIDKKDGSNGPTSRAKKQIASNGMLLAKSEQACQ